jgi:hypothetical protein
LKVLLLVQVTINQLAVNLGLGKHSLDSKYPSEELYIVLHELI